MLLHHACEKEFDGSLPRNLHGDSFVQKIHFHTNVTNENSYKSVNLVSTVSQIFFFLFMLKDCLTVTPL